MDYVKKLSVNEMNSAAFLKLTEEGEKKAALDMQAFVKTQVFNIKKNDYTYQGKVANKCYWCKDCNDKFALASSLDYHMNRCSVNITLNCTFCMKTLEFTNKCKMMSHIRSHPQMKTINIKDIKAEPLAISKLNDSKLNLSLDEHSVPDFIPEGYAMSGYKPLYIPNQNQTVITAVSKLNLLFENAFKAFDNYESPFYVNPTVSEIANIFKPNHTKVIEDTVKDCATQPVPLNTDFSYLPCVENTNTSINKTTVNSTSNSFPEIIADTASCAICLLKFTAMRSTRSTFELNKLRQNHFQTLSVGKSCPCLYCDLILLNPCSQKAHMLLHTPNSELFVCPECGVSCQSSEELNFHLSRTCYHFLRCMAVRCFNKNCGPIRKDVLRKHIIDCHTNPIVKCPNCNLEFGISEMVKNNLEITDSNLKGVMSHKCKFCFKTIPQDIIRDMLNNDVRIQQNMAIVPTLSYVCVGCNTIFKKLGETKLHIFQCSFFNSVYTNTYIQKFISISENRLPPRTIKDNNTTIPHTIKDNNTTIPHSSSSYIDILEKDAVTTSDIDQIKDVMNIELFCDKSTQNKGQNKRSPTSYDKEEKLRTKRKYTKRKSKNSNSPISAEKDSVESVETFEKKTCKKCSFTSEDNDVFRDHLLSHRLTATAYQCMECGECFVAESSLCTHLIIYHKITKPEEYIKTHNCFDKQAILKQKKDKLLFRANKKTARVMENQCQICFEQFDNSIDHDKHFRVHGMAFLLKKTKMQVI